MFSFLFVSKGKLKNDKLDFNGQAIKNSPAESQQVSNEVQIQETARESPESCIKITDKIKNDKSALDLIIAVEQVMQERYMSEHKISEFKGRIQHFQSTVEELNHDLTFVKSRFAEKERLLDELTQKLTEKNFSIDRLMEENRELQSTMSDIIRDQKNTIHIEQEKYRKLEEQYQKDNLEGVGKLKKKEEQILSLETENANLLQLYENIRNENIYLLSMINDFTNRMTLSFDHYSKKEE